MLNDRDRDILGDYKCEKCGLVCPSWRFFVIHVLDHYSGPPKLYTPSEVVDGLLKEIG